MPVKIQHRRGTSSDWTTYNYVLAAGEIGVETDTGRFKLGDGTTAYNSLAYRGIQGTAGTTGAQGTKGIQGYAGAQGMTGVQAQSIQTLQWYAGISSFSQGSLTQSYMPNYADQSNWTIGGASFAGSQGFEMDWNGSGTGYFTLPGDGNLMNSTTYGQVFTIFRGGTQTITIQGASGVTIQAAQGIGQSTTASTPKLWRYGAVAQAIRVANNRWYVYGDISN